MKGQKNYLVWKLLNLIDSGQRLGIDDIALELEVSRRTALRYIDTIYGAGFPLYYDRDRKSYRFMEGFSLKKANLTQDELHTLLMSEQYMNLLGSTFRNIFEEAKDKIEISSGKRGSAVRPPIIPFLIKAEPMEDNPRFKLFFDTFVRCYAAGRAAELDYETMWSGARRTREVGPYGIVHHEGRLFLVGHCFFRKQVRTFSFEGIHSVKIGGKKYEVPSDFDLEKHFEKALGVDYADGSLYNARIRFKPDAVKWILHRRWHPSQRIRRNPDGTADITFHIAGEEELLRWTTQWADHAELLEPQWLREKLIQRLRNMVNVYES